MSLEPLSGLKYHSGPTTFVEYTVSPLSASSVYIGTPLMFTTGGTGGYVVPRTTVSAKPIIGVSNGYTAPGGKALVNINPHTIYEIFVSGAAVTQADIGKMAYLSTPDDLFSNSNRSCSLLVSSSLTLTWAANLAVKVVDIVSDNPAQPTTLQKVLVKVLYPENN